MADTYLRATQNNDVANTIRNFANEFAAKLELVKGMKK
jgi:hypothetical protein